MSERRKIQNSKFYSLSAGAYSVAADLEEGEDNIARYLKWAIDFARMLQLQASFEIKDVEIPMKPHKQIDYPEDMVENGWILVGFKSGDTLKVFTQDKSIPRTFDTIDCVKQPNEPTDNFSADASGDCIPFHGFNNVISGGDHFYGAMLHYNYRGYFDADDRLRVFNFKRVVNNVNTVYLKYFTDGINYNGKTILPVASFQSLQDWIHYKRLWFAGDPQWQAAKMIFEDSLDQYFVNKLDLTLDDIREALWSGYKQTPKS